MKVVVTLALVLVCLAAAVSAASNNDYYGLLGVNKRASARDIKRAYRRISRELHPDKNPGDKEAEAKFMAATKAYEVLSDEKLRKVYDRGGVKAIEQHEKQGGNGGGFNPFDIFGFNRGGGQADNEVRTPSLELDLEVSLEDLYTGTELEALVAKQVLCPDCDGSGAQNPDDVATCPVCNGRGVTITRHQMAPGFVQQMQTTCKKCGGKGKIVKSVCRTCGGRKVVPGSSTIDLYIEAGAPNGHRLEFPMEADQAPEATPGDIVFVVKTAPHPVFERDPNAVDLHTRAKISLLEALVGFEATFDHLGDHTYTLAQDGITKPGQIIKVPGEGMPHFEDSDSRGDLYVTIEVVMPSKLTSAQKDQLRTILKDA